MANSYGELAKRIPPFHSADRRDTRRQPGLLTISRDDLCGERNVKRTKPIHRKPIGEDGPVRVTHTADGETKIEWKKIEYPAEKPAQEAEIASAFVTIFNQEHNTAWQVTRLAENNFDFEMQSGGEKRYLELREIVIPGKKRGPPYAPGEQVIEPAKFAKTINAAVNSKALRYPKTRAQPLDLLIYVTHWRFRPNKAVLQLVAHELDEGAHPFSRVHFLSRHDGSSGQVVTLYPNKDLIKGLIPGQLAQKRYVNFDPGSGVPIRDGDEVGTRFNLSPATTKKFMGG